MRHHTDRGSASLWVLACCALVLAVTYAVTVRGSAVLARHRAEAAADLAALAAAGQIGVSVDICRDAARVALANGATVQSCVPALDPDGRSGTVTVRVRMEVELPLVGATDTVATARAGRDAVSP
jgi:secretion/DNA translocation related TadE-like protein